MLHVATTKMANDLIKKHLIETSEMKRVKRFDQTTTAMQCYNCQKQEHMTKKCSNPTRCAECSQDHDTRSYQKKAPGASKTCVGCEGTGHAAYEKTCSVRVREAQRTRQRIATKPLLYGPLRERSPPTPLKRGDGFILIGSKKKRKAASEIIELRETSKTQGRS